MSNTTKTAIVTGASSGIGRQTAISLSQAGWNVVLAARRADALAETISLCSNPLEKCLSVPGDVTDEGFVQKLFSQAVERFGWSPVICGCQPRVYSSFQAAWIFYSMSVLRVEQLNNE